MGYSRRNVIEKFTLLRAALDKFQSQYPDARNIKRSDKVGTDEEVHRNLKIE